MQENIFYICCAIFTFMSAYKEMLLIVHNRKHSDFKIEFIKLCRAFKNETNIVRALDIYDRLIREIISQRDQKHLDVNIKWYSHEEKKKHCLENLKFLAQKYKCWNQISN